MHRAVPRFALLVLLSAGCSGPLSGTGDDTTPEAGTGDDAAVLDGAGGGSTADTSPPRAHDGASGADGSPASLDAGDRPTPDASPDASLTPRQKLLAFIQGISGKQTMAGEHNRESSQGDFITAMDTVTGHYPALWGGDFLFEDSEIKNRPNMIHNLMSGWDGGAVVSLMYHACPPTQGESCGWDGGVLSSLTDAQWSDLTTEGGMLNGVWKSRLDAIVPYFQTLKDAGIAATFRPQHEMNQGAFWWGGRPGAGGTSRLFQITHDYLVNTKGLDNIVWIWSVQDIWSSTDNSFDFGLYDPGDGYWDVMALDFYDGAGFTTPKYQAMLAQAGSKPIAIGECEVLPTPAEIAAQPRWVYFMGWAELIQNNDTNAQITATYTAPSVLTQDRMPGW